VGQTIGFRRLPTLRIGICLILFAGAIRAADPLVYVGTYTGSGSKGIYAFRLQTKNGKLTALGLAGETSNPSFLLAHPNHRVLYAVNENGTSRQMGSVSAFAIDAQSGKLKLLNWVSSRGGAPCHLALDRTARWLAVANCEGGNIAILPLLPDGKVGDAVYYAPTGGHPTGVAFSPDNKILLAADRGLDRIFAWRFDESKGTIVPNDPYVTYGKPGVGLRHILFHPSGRAVYALDELDSTVTVYAYDATTGGLQHMQVAQTLPGFVPNNSPAEMALNSDASLLYCSNRGHESIYTFAIDLRKLTLSPGGDAPTLGTTPRGFAIDPTGEYLVAANQDSNDLATFKVNPPSGELTPAARLVKDVPKPVCVLFVEQ